MTRRKSLTGSLFAMPAALVDAALAELTPEQRTKIDPNKAEEIMLVCVDAAARIGRIIERPPPQADKREALQKDGAAHG